MAEAAALFHSADAEVQTLHRRITPSEEQFEQQQERWNALADHLLADLRERSGYEMRSWLQGSYKFATQVRPARKGAEFDIDLGVYFQWAGDPEDGNRTAKAFKRVVQASLDAYEDDEVLEVTQPAKNRCSRIRFKGDFHIDVPSYHLDADRDQRTLATEENGWEDSDPKALYTWFKDAFSEDIRPTVRRQIRYVKIWAQLKFSDERRPSSTLLTVLVAEALEGRANLPPDDELLGEVLDQIASRLAGSASVLNPADTGEDLLARLSEDSIREFLERLDDFVAVAKRALGAIDEVSAADHWADAFEHFFPLPEATSLEETAKSAYRLPVRALIPEVRVRAVSRTNALHRWDGMNEIGPIPIDCDIHFEVINPRDLPGDATVYWTVRNEGGEAELVNDLGHRAGTGLAAEERSAYEGVHYMDCTIKRLGVVLGLRRVRVIVRGNAIARRNPKKKPDYVKLRGRR